MSKDNADSGFGFKDKAKAEETLKLLESEDSHYQVLTVKGLLGRAKKVLTCELKITFLHSYLLSFNYFNFVQKKFECQVVQMFVS